MTVVNTETGEIVEFDAAAAERRAERITTRLDAIAENYSRVLPMIREAIEKRDDIALGYRSPGEYVSDRFGQSLAGLGIEVRRAVVGELTEAGLSTRAIAPIVGVSERTAAYDAAGVQGCTPAPKTAESDSLPASESAPSSADGPQEREAGGSSRDDRASSRPAVTGIDGKTYSRGPSHRILKVAPAPDPAEWDEQDRAEELADNLARNISLTYALTNPERRAEYLANWRRGINSRPVLGQNFVTPKHMRDLAEALNTFATEWEQANV